jgi:carboxymethylenebutenolidase
MTPVGTMTHTGITIERGVSLPVELFVPGAGNGGAIVMGAEANGPNSFIRRVSARLAGLGYLVAIPDYYRRDWPGDPDDYTDLARLHQRIDELNFRQASFDLVDTIAEVRRLPEIDGDRVAVWGYCTGGTLALLAAGLDPSLAAAVLFYPSQPVFAVLNAKRPVHPIDLMWAIRCPVLMFYGDCDPVLPTALRTRLAERFREWDIAGRLVVYPDAEHVFAGDMPERYRADYDADSWRIAVEFLADHVNDHVKESNA